MEIFQNSLRCNFCQKLFDKRNILKRHLREKHYCGNVYKCNMCTVSFVRKERLIRHLKSVHFDIKYTCEECDMKFVEKYKHNYHLVHCHGYAYCSNCKIAYRTFKPIDLRGPQTENEGTKGAQENEHICTKYSQFFKCFICSCKGRKVYNRLNFFIRHLQLEHKICEFQKIKDIIDQNTFETRKMKRKSRIRAKTLEGHNEEVIAEDLRELFDYAKGYYGSSQFQNRTDSPNDATPNNEPDSEGRTIKEDSREDSEDVSAAPKDEEKTETDYKGDLSLKELMQNINIMCMMENNYKKYLSAAQLLSPNGSSSKCKEEEDTSRNFDSKDIVLGKRGRPSKSHSLAPHSFVETVVGSYLNKMEDSDKVCLRKMMVRRRQVDLPDKDVRETKLREKKKMKPVYFDDILMETLNITEKVSKRHPVFYIRRSSTFFELNGLLECREGMTEFVSPQSFEIVLPMADQPCNEKFDSLKTICQKKKKTLRSTSDPQKPPSGDSEYFYCEQCSKEFFYFFGFLQHKTAIHKIE